MSISVQQFIEGTPEVPRLLQADAYTIGSGPHVSEDAKTRSVYHIVPRRGFVNRAPFVADERIIFYGLRRIIRDLFTVPITMDEIENTQQFLDTFHAGGSPFHWDRKLWERVVQDHDGRIPIRIQAIPDGQVVFPGEPVMQITSAYGFGELANYFESTLVKVWATMERVTMARWWKSYLRDKCREQKPDWTDDQREFAISIMCHDFGDRAGICPEESEVLGQAHLMVFPGTDTVAGAYLDYKDTHEPYGCSIHALAHRTVQGFPTEMEAHAALYEVGQHTGITAHVSDTYDFNGTVERLCEKLANEWKDSANVLVLRPDSGDAYNCILHILRTAKKHGVSDRVRWIQGDSMNWEMMMSIIEELPRDGFSAFDSGAFGVGGHLRNSIARDHTGLSMKLAAVGENYRPVCKLSQTPAKASLPGVVQVLARANFTVVPGSEQYDEEGRLVIWYDGLEDTLEKSFKPQCLLTNTEVRHEIDEGFFQRNPPPVVMSVELAALREEVLRQQNAVWEEHAEVS